MDKLRQKKGFIIDMDGVIYHGNRLLPGVKEFVEWLYREEKRFLFLTNSSRHTPKELQKKPTGKSIFILDEPTTGLHSEDIKKLLTILNRIVDNGDTVIVIEHNLDVIKVADYIIDLGPEGGNLGGEIVATGTPEQVAKNPNSYTGIFLKKILEQK